MKFFSVLIVLFSLFLFSAGCHHNGQKTEDKNVSQSGVHIFGAVQPPGECTLLTKKKFVYDVFHDSYLWAESVKTVDFEDNETYPDEETLLEDLKDVKDRFSFIMSKKAYDDFFEAGKNIGFGIFFDPVVAQNSDAYTIDAFVLLLVYPGSSADKVGLRRSDQILAIDGHTVDEVYKNDDLFRHYFLEDEPLNAHFEVRRTDGTLLDITVSKEEYSVRTVIRRSVYQTESRKIGYLLFQSFTGTSEEELYEAFAYFKSNEIDDLIVDLRYNGGGYVYIARELASLIGGWRSGGKIFNQTLFNQKYSAYNSRTLFYYYLVYQISLPRVFVLTTEMTCSASELVINALRASVTGVDVIQIGTRTCGKPYAMIGGPYCDKYLLPVQMKNANADNAGDYVDGLQPTCYSKDNYLYDFADPHEDTFAAALYYIQNDACSQEYGTEKREPRTILSGKERIKHGFRGQYAIY